MVGAGLTFMEYFAKYPSIVEFRDAKPFNRLRFATLALTGMTAMLVLEKVYLLVFKVRRPHIANPIVIQVWGNTFWQSTDVF